MADLRKLNISTEELSKATNPFHVEIKDTDLMRIDEAYPQLLVQEVMSEFNQQTNEYVAKQLVSLNIDKDVLLKQTQEIQRLNYKIAELQKQIPKWHLVADNDFPTNDDNRFYLCISENHEEDIPTMFQYDSELGFGWWHDIYDEHTLGFVDSEFRTVEEEHLEKVIAWMELPKFEGVE